MPAAASRPPDLTSAREQVAEFLTDSPGSTGPISTQARYPLRSLEPASEAKLAARTAAGLVGPPEEFPRRPALRRTVLPSAVLAIVDAAALVVAIAVGSTLLAVVAAVLLVIFVLIAAGGWRFVTTDPLRLSAREIRAREAARSWHSTQNWSDAPAGHGLVAAATDAATRICRTPFWRSGPIRDLQVHLDLGRELDEIDAAAHRLAAGDANDPAWGALVDRVAALTAYADQVDGFERRRAEGAIGDTRHDYGTDEEEVVALLVYLNAAG